MNNEKIKSFDELNADEHMVLNAFRLMKMEHDKAKFELMSYKLNDLINSYAELQTLRDNIREKYFSMLEDIANCRLANVDVDYKKWEDVLTNERTEWHEEVEVMSEFKYHLDDLLMQLNDGTIEQLIIEEEKNIA